MASIDELLKPTLRSGDGQHRAIYSTTAGYVTSFFGGPFAAIAMTTLNSWRLRRLATDALPLLAATTLSILIVVLIYRPQLLGLADFGLSGTLSRLLLRAYALALFGGAYLLHIRYYRNMEIMSLQSPNGWIAGAGCGVLGAALTATLVWSLGR